MWTYPHSTQSAPAAKQIGLRRAATNLPCQGEVSQCAHWGGGVCSPNEAGFPGPEAAA